MSCSHKNLRGIEIFQERETEKEMEKEKEKEDEKLATNVLPLPSVLPQSDVNKRKRKRTHTDRPVSLSLSPSSFLLSLFSFKCQWIDIFCFYLSYSSFPPILPSYTLSFHISLSSSPLSIPLHFSN